MEDIMRRFVFAAFVLTVLTACQAAPPEMTEAEIAQYEAEVIQEIKSRIDAFYEALLQGDAQTVASFWTSDASVLMPGVRVSGSEISTFVAELLETATFTDYDVEILDWFIHGDVAYEISSYDETLLVEGQEVMVRNFDFVRWEKVNGVWMIDRLVAGPRDAPPEG
jgi:ketosteroid isomerase-like protein